MCCPPAATSGTLVIECLSTGGGGHGAVGHNLGKKTARQSGDNEYHTPGRGPLNQASHDSLSERPACAS